jgi:hypothetical protein
MYRWLSHLPEASSAGIGTWSRYQLWLPGFHRAGPSTPLDEYPLYGFKVAR